MMIRWINIKLVFKDGNPERDYIVISEELSELVRYHDSYISYPSWIHVLMLIRTILSYLGNFLFNFNAYWTLFRYVLFQ